MQPYCKIRSTYFVCEWHRIKGILMFRCIDTRDCGENSVPPLTFKVNQSLIRKLQTRSGNIASVAHSLITTYV